MKLKYVKFSDERNKKFCIKTIIGRQGDVWKVRKEAVYEDGKGHIRNMERNASLLKEYFNCDVCDIRLQGDVAEFAYMQGESLADRYLAAIEANDIERFRELLLEHKRIILGRKENSDIFQLNRSYEKVFGDGQAVVGKQALCCCNYDATASNIVFVDNRPSFIDYEWVFDFSVPVDVVLYHCILDFYLHCEEAQDFFSIEEAMQVLEIECDREYLEQTYRSFYDYVIKEEQGESYALVKAICLKKKKTLQELEHENLVNFCECDRLQGVISELNKEIVHLEEEYRTRDAQLYDAQVRELQLQQQVEDVQRELKKVAEEAFVQEQELKRVSEEAFVQKQELEAIKATKVWKIYSKLKRGNDL